MNALNDVSVVVPIGQGDLSWKRLLLDLKMLPAGAEVILVAKDLIAEEDLLRAQSNLVAKLWFKQSLEGGRAEQLNLGASIATNEFVWFLHADSQLPRSSFLQLSEVISKKERSLYYFQLKFFKDGPLLMDLNSWGANLRSGVLGMPFGDQGFCILKNTFEELGGFDTSAPYGEDHLFVWKARRQGICLHGLESPILTSARKYKKNGWTKTTFKHVYLTLKQAAPECVGLLKEKVWK